MPASDSNAMTSSTSTLARITRRCVGLFQVPSPSVVDSCPQDAGYTTFTDARGASSPLNYAAPNPNGDWDDTASHRVHTFGIVQLKTSFALLYQMVIFLIVQVTVVASDIASLGHRVAVVESTQILAAVRDQETAALARQVSELCERVATQENRIACLELSQRAETESYRKTIQELSTRLDDKNKGRDDAVERLCQSFQNCQRSMECQAARITGVKADTARKLTILQSGLAGVQAELAVVKVASVPVNAPYIDQASKEAQRLRILESIAQGIEDDGVVQAIEKQCPLPPVRSAATLLAASTSSSSVGTTEEVTVNNHEDLITPCAYTQPSANKIPATSMISIETTPMPTIPMERLIPAKFSGKENRSCNSSTTTLQNIQPLQLDTGRSTNVSDKPPTASLKKVQLRGGLPSKVSAVLKSRSSMLPAPRKSRYPNLTQFDAVGDGGSFDEVKTAANPPPGESETRTEQRKTIKCTPIITSQSLLESALSMLVKKEPATVLPASSSLTALDAALQAMQLDGDSLLAPVPALNCLNDDLSFSVVSPIPMITRTKRNRDDEYENIHGPSKQGKAKPSRSPLKPTFTGNAVSSLASSSLTALDAALQGESEILTLLPGLDYPSVDFSFTPVTPVFPKGKSQCKHESIFVSPMKASIIKPSRRL